MPFPASFALAFKANEKLRRWAIFFLIIPFFTSYLVRTFSWFVILSENGVVNALLGYIGLGPYTMLNTNFGTLVGYMTLTLPLVVILQTITMANIDKTLIEAARNLGCRPLSTIWRVIIPLSKTGLIVAAIFCFILSFGDFVAPFYLGGSQEPTLPILILDTTKSGQQWPRAAVVAIVMMITLFSVAFIRITIDDVVDVIRDQAEHSVMSMVGLDEDEDVFAPILLSSRRRSVWLSHLVAFLLNGT